MKRLVGMAAALLLVGNAQAQTPAPSAPSTASAQIDETRLELARELVDALRLRKTMEVMIKDLMPVIREQQKSELAGLSPDQARLLQESVDEALSGMIDRMLQEYVPVYAAEFSAEELRASIDFYRSPVGQAMLDKTPKLSAASADIVRKVMPEVQADLLRRFCSKVDCANPSKPDPKTNPS